MLKKYILPRAILLLCLFVVNVSSQTTNISNQFRKIETKIFTKLDTVDFHEFINPQNDNSGSIHDCIFNEAYFTFRNQSTPLENYILKNVEFNNVCLSDIDLFQCKLEWVIFRNCHIEEVDINNSQLQSVFFIDCDIPNLMLSSCKGNHISISNRFDSLSKISILTCTLNSLSIKGEIAKLNIENGEVTQLDLSRIVTEKPEISLHSVQLINPKLFDPNIESSGILFKTNFKDVIFYPDSRSVLLEELEADSLNSSVSYYTKRDVIRNYYQNARASYLILAKISLDQKVLDVADYFEYRSKVCERKATTTKFGDFCGWLYNEKLRGNYGTNSFVVLNSILIIFLGFSFLYFLLSCFHIAFGYSIRVRFSGQAFENQMPQIIVFRKGIKGVLRLIRECLLFSLNQMLLGGISRDYHIYDFASQYLFPPRYYRPLGIGRYFALIQGLLGLLLIFFLISSFLRITR